MTTVRKCKGCSGPVQEDQALLTYEEFFEVYCIDCAAGLRTKQAEDLGKRTPGSPQEAPGAATKYPWPVYRQTPDGPIFRTEEKADLPPNAIFHGYIRTAPNGRGPVYQLFKFPPKLNPADLETRARTALQAGGFNLD